MKTEQYCSISEPSTIPPYLAGPGSGNRLASRRFWAALSCLCSIGAAAQPIDVRIEMRGEQVVVDVQATVAAKPADAWSVLTDYDHMARFVSALKSSAIVGRNGNSLEVEQRGEAKVGFMSFSFYSLRAVQLTPEKEIHSKLIRGDFKSYEFTTRILDSGTGTLIVHHGEYVPTSWVPPGLGPSLIKAQTSKQYAELVAEILARRRVDGPRPEAAPQAPSSQR
jgi:ribosome-associated toxin RatA of RatAB toxin-antitoxin module